MTMRRNTNRVLAVSLLLSFLPYSPLLLATSIGKSPALPLRFYYSYANGDGGIVARLEDFRRGSGPASISSSDGLTGVWLPQPIRKRRDNTQDRELSPNQESDTDQGDGQDDNSTLGQTPPPDQHQDHNYDDTASNPGGSQEPNEQNPEPMADQVQADITPDQEQDPPPPPSSEENHDIINAGQSSPEGGDQSQGKENQPPSETADPAEEDGQDPNSQVEAMDQNQGSDNNTNTSGDDNQNQGSLTGSGGDNSGGLNTGNGNGESTGCSGCQNATSQPTTKAPPQSNSGGRRWWRRWWCGR